MELLNNNTKEKENGGNGMNGINDFGVSDILTGRGLGLGGFGYGCNAGYGSPYANLASIQHGIAGTTNAVSREADCSRGIVLQGVDNLVGRLEGLQRDNQFEATNTNTTNGFNRVCDKLVSDHTNNLIRSAENNLNIFRELADMRAESAKCCCETQKELLKMQLENQKATCETQKLIVSENAATRELINQNTIRAAVDQNNISATVGAINSAAAQNTAALIAAIQNIGHHHR